jgi:hypothetical protein
VNQVPNIKQQLLMFDHKSANRSNFSCVVSAILFDLEGFQIDPYVFFAFPDMRMSRLMVLGVDPYVESVPLSK